MSEVSTVKGCDVEIVADVRRYDLSLTGAWAIESAKAAT
jgi:hypothetical protein